MFKYRVFSFILVLSIEYSFSFVEAQNWPGFRGPNGDGTSTETNIPTKWDSVTNVVWKVPVPGSGYSSPVVWNDRLFLTTAFLETQERVLLCYDTKNGKLLWQKTVLKTPLEAKHTNNGYASGTPATDGTLVFVSFLEGQDVIVAAYDFTGKQVWLQKPGKFISRHGYSCSPVVFEDKVIINGDSQQGESFVAALSRKDGKTIWKIPHENRAHDFSTPVIRNINGKKQMIFGGNKQIASYNPDDGSKYWSVNGPSEEFCSSPVYNDKHGLVLMSSSYPIKILFAIKPDGQGDVTGSKIVWQSTKSAYYVPSPVCTPDYLFTSPTTGEVHCIDVATGNILWVENLGLQYASAVLANGLVYMPNDDGVITVIKPGPRFEYVSKNPIGERMYASPAISNGKIYLRGFQHLFCIGSGSSK
jgi:outer membrane protein assembly factor BamB